MDYSKQIEQQRSYSGHGGVSGTAFENVPMESVSVVRDGLSMNEQTLSELHETISRLEGRLDPTLSPMPPQPTTTPGTPVGPPRSHVANRLASLHDGYCHAVARLQELIRRVEV